MLCAFASPIATRTLKAPHLSTCLQLASILLIVTAITGVQTGALAGFEAFKLLAHLNTTRAVLGIPMIVLGAYLHGVLGATVGLVASYVVSCILAHFAVMHECARNKIILDFANCLKELRVVGAFSIPAAAAGFFVGPINWFANALLVRQPNGYIDMGVFNAATQWANLVTMLPNIIVQPVLSLLSSSRGQGDHKGHEKLFQLNVIFAAAASSLLGATLLLASPIILKAYGNGYATLVPILVIVVFSSVIGTVGSVVDQYILSAGDVWWRFVLNGIWASAYVVTAMLFIPSHKGQGRAWAALAAYGIHLIGMIIYVSYRHNKVLPAQLVTTHL